MSAFAYIATFGKILIWIINIIMHETELDDNYKSILGVASMNKWNIHEKFEIFWLFFFRKLNRCCHYWIKWNYSWVKTLNEICVNWNNVQIEKKRRKISMTNWWKNRNQSRATVCTEIIDCVHFIRIAVLRRKEMKRNNGKNNRQKVRHETNRHQ